VAALLFWFAVAASLATGWLITGWVLDRAARPANRPQSESGPPPAASAMRTKDPPISPSTALLPTWWDPFTYEKIR